MQHHFTVGLDGVSGRKQQMLNILAFDPASSNGHFHLTDPVGQACARTSDPNTGNAGSGAFLGPFHHIADGVGGRSHIHDIAAPHTLAGAVAGAKHDKLPGFRLAENHCRNAE